MDGRMFDGMISGLLFVGACIGVTICGLGWFLWWLAHHTQVSWVN